MYLYIATFGYNYMINRLTTKYDVDKIFTAMVTYRDVKISVIGELENYVDKVYKALHPLVDGMVVLSTCNRFEVYVSSYNYDKVVTTLRRVIGNYFRYFKIIKGEKAIKHLFKVASGLDSAILGEEEILEQVLQAWRRARKSGYTDEILDMIFNDAIKTGKRARSETGISKGAIGYPEASVSLAIKTLGSLDNRSILIIGSGLAAKKMLSSICSQFKPRKLIVATRTLRNAERLKNILCGKTRTVVNLNSLKEIKELFDVTFIATKGNVDLNVKSKVIIDISVPPLVTKDGRDNVIIYNIEDVENVAKSLLRNKFEDVVRVEKIIEEELKNTKMKLLYRSADVAISHIMTFAKEVAERELKRSSSKLKCFDENKDELNIMIWSYTKKVFRPLIFFIRDLMVNERYDVLNHLLSYYFKHSHLGLGEDNGSEHN